MEIISIHFLSPSQANFFLLSLDKNAPYPREALKSLTTPSYSF